MTMTEVRALDALELERGDHAVIPVPEGRLVLRDVPSPVAFGTPMLVVILVPFGDGAPQELARFRRDMGFDLGQMVTVALTALGAWR